MWMLTLGVALFLAVHVTRWPKGLRGAIVARIGEGPWKGLYSLVSLAGFALILAGWPQARAEAPYLYEPPVWMKHVALLIVPIAFVLLAAAYLPAGRIKAAVKHPMVVAVILWAGAHLLANGDAASLLLFGAFLAWAAFDRLSVGLRERAGEAAPPKPGPNAMAGDLGAIAVGLAAAALTIIWLHPVAFGVPVWPA